MDYFLPSDITFTRPDANSPYRATLALDGRFAVIHVVMASEGDGGFLRNILVGTFTPSIGRGCGLSEEHPDCVCARLHAKTKADPFEFTSPLVSLINHGCPAFQMILQPEFPQIYLVDCAAGPVPVRKLHDVSTALNAFFQAVLSQGRADFGTSLVRILVDTYFTPTVRILFSTNGALDASLWMPVEAGVKYHVGPESVRALH